MNLTHEEWKQLASDLYRTHSCINPSPCPVCNLWLAYKKKSTDWVNSCEYCKGYPTTDNKCHCFDIK